MDCAGQSHDISRYFGCVTDSIAANNVLSFLGEGNMTISDYLHENDTSTTRKLT